MQLEPEITRFSMKVMTDRRLYDRVKRVALSSGATAEQRMLLENTLKGFVRHGVALEVRDPKRPLLEPSVLQRHENSRAHLMSPNRTLRDTRPMPKAQAHADRRANHQESPHVHNFAYESLTVGQGADSSAIRVQRLTQSLLAAGTHALPRHRPGYFIDT